MTGAQELMKVLEEHELDCACPICKAYTKGATPAEGMKAAEAVLWDLKANAGDQLVN